VDAEVLCKVTGRNGVIVDTVPTNLLDVMAVCGKGTVILDHHWTNKALVESVGSVLGGKEVSGVGMAWAFVYGPDTPLPRHWDLIQKRDLGVPLVGDDKLFIDALYALLPMDDLTACFDILDKLRNPQMVTVYETIGAGLASVRHISVRQLFNPTTTEPFVDRKGRKVHVLNCTDWGLVNDLTTYIFQSSPDVEYVILWHGIIDKTTFFGPAFKLSVRGRSGGFDTTTLTKALLGGGGHTAASGAITLVHPVDIVRCLVY
jgi:hypothetical protein